MRTIYTRRGTELLQKTLAAQSVDFAIVDLGDNGGDQPWSTFTEPILAAARAPFNLAAGPLLRGRLYCRAANDQLLLLVVAQLLLLVLAKMLATKGHVSMAQLLLLGEGEEGEAQMLLLVVLLQPPVGSCGLFFASSSFFFFLPPLLPFLLCRQDHFLKHFSIFTCPYWLCCCSCCWCCFLWCCCSC